MTVWELGRLLVRRWYIVLGGMLLTFTAAFLVLTHQGVYFSKVDVVFLAPLSARYPNSLVATSQSLITTAGIVERQINHAAPAASTASASATLVGQGVYDGYQIRLPDAGGQWAHNFNRQVLDVQVAGPSEEVVRARQREIVDDITATLDEMQANANVAPENLIRTELAAPVPTVSYMAGDRKRAVAMTVLLGSGLTLVLVILLGGPHRRHPGEAERVPGRSRFSRPHTTASNSH